LLLIGLLALLLGVFGAVYFQRAQDPQVANNAPAQPRVQPSAAAAPEAPPPHAAASSENRPQEQAAMPPESNSAAPAPPEPQTAQAPPPPAPAPSETLPQTQANNPPALLDNEAQRRAEISPSAAPADVAAAAPRYWVEFGAYEVTLYADRLKQSLDQLGIGATVDDTLGKHGRHYLRVRSSGDSDHSTAATQLATAESALHIAPVLHRVAAISQAPMRVPEAKAKPSPNGDYWVQFGAFHEHQNAEQTLSDLHKSGIQASVIERKRSGDGPLYLIRVSSLANRAQAVQIAQQGSAALHSNDVMIRASRGAAPDLRPHQPPG
jgi:cell division protein FtsN